MNEASGSFPKFDDFQCTRSRELHSTARREHRAIYLLLASIFYKLLLFTYGKTYTIREVNTNGNLYNLLLHKKYILIKNTYIPGTRETFLEFIEGLSLIKGL